MNLSQTITRLRELESTATKGPWHSDFDGDVFTEAEKEYCPGMEQELFRTLGSTKCGPDRGDAAFIAESRNALPALLDVIEKMRACLEWYATKESWGAEHDWKGLGQCARDVLKSLDEEK